MSDLLHDEAFEASVKRQFPDLKVEYQLVSLAEAKLYAFFISLQDESQLTCLWRDIRNFIAVNFQTRLEDDFSKWNLYLFFLVKGPVKIELKYQVENDTFSSRKVVVGEHETNDELIAQHITNRLDTLVGDNVLKEAELPFIPDKIIGDALLELETAGVRKITINSKLALDIIIAHLKDNHEI